MEEYAGRAAIGHVRYATCGADEPQLRPAVRAAARLQVEVVRLRLQRPARQLRRTPRRTPRQRHDYHLAADNDTEVIMHYLAHELPGRRAAGPRARSSATSATKFDGAYNIVFLNAMGDMVVLRDPLGIRPLCYAQRRPAVRRRQRERAAARTSASDDDPVARTRAR